MVALEVEDRADRGPAEAVDRLVVVPDDRQIRRAGGEPLQQHVLRTIDVLVLVDEHVDVALAIAVPRLLVCREHADHAENQSTEVEGAGPQEEFLVADRRAHHRVAARVGPDVERLGRVLAAVEEGAQRLRRHLLLAHVGVGESPAAQGEAVGIVVDREGGGQADTRRLAAQPASADRVEGSHGESTRPLAEQPLESLAHFPRGLVGEGDREDLLRADTPLLDEAGDAVGEDAGLAAPGPREHEQRGSTVGDRIALRRVQVVEVDHLRAELSWWPPKWKARGWPAC